MRHLLAITVLALLLLVTISAGRSQTTAFEQACERLAERQQEDGARLQELFKIDWEHTMRENPEFATRVGWPGQNNRWSDLSLEAIARRKRETAAPLKVIRSIDRSRLGEAERLNYDLFKYNSEQAAEGAKFEDEYLPVMQIDGLQQNIAQLLTLAPHATVKDYQDILARLEGIPRLLDQTLVLLKKGLASKISPPRITLRDVPAQVEQLMVADAQKNPLLVAFGEFPRELSAGDQARLKQAAETVLKDKVVGALDRLHQFLMQEYIPKSRETVAWSDLPNGKDWYEFKVRESTTTSLTVNQIHELGLSEVKRIRAEMDAVIAGSGFKGSFSDFSKFLRTDPRFFYTDAESLLKGYRDIAKRADPELARLFGKLPRLPYGVKAVPDYAAKSQTTAYYEEGSVPTGRPGWFFANTYGLETRPKWEMEPLTLHEAVPGHHLQLALAQEIEGAPEFRKYGGCTAYVEGWGLYAESLGGEMGFYRDPYTKYGQLTYEIWRAIRLVLDTGIHAKGWTRQRAIDYFMANSSKSEHDITVEVDRYIVTPGQALAYKIGELKLKELRALATRELGEKFDIRAFHDEVLDSGAMPLDMLEKRVREWVRRPNSNS
jgi:uncharacterized protein (DUF885 family)